LWYLKVLSAVCRCIFPLQSLYPAPLFLPSNQHDGFSSFENFSAPRGVLPFRSFHFSASVVKGRNFCHRDERWPSSFFLFSSPYNLLVLLSSYSTNSFSPPPLNCARTALSCQSDSDVTRSKKGCLALLSGFSRIVL